MQEQAIFIEALEKEDPAERAIFLNTACAGDAALRERIERLLQRHVQADSFLESRATGAYTPAPGDKAAAPPSEGPGAVLGLYKLLQEIGEGGMGSVWMAEQTRPVQRKVALKIIKAGMDSRQVVARFEAERQALALMDHANIAKVLDAGATDSGRPYFVMELVKGVPITTCCDEHRLTPRQRLELFVPVCQAIQHAHQKGIIHRDIKPSNVLVAPYDGRPVVKVIDFGIAKATGQRLTEKTLFTEFGAVVGTLEYMSPEQAELNNQDIDTRSDIYSLGVLLYELLTGSTPLERKRLKGAAFVEVLRLIREEEPPQPSTRLSASRDTLASISAQRQMEPAKLTQLVRGELDWIAMRALAKDRGRRYDTANAFAADVQRYLAGEPVLAAPPSATYRLRKLARKHRAALTTAATVLLLLVAGAAVSTWQAVRATQAEAQTHDQLVEKNRQHQRAEANFFRTLDAMDQFLTEVGQNELASMPHLEHVRRRLLEKALTFFEDLLQEKGDNPDVRFEAGLAYRRVGDIQHQLGQDEKAKAAYQEGLTLLEKLTAEQPDEAKHQRELALCHYSRALLLHGTGSPQDAEQALGRALDLQRELVAQRPKQSEYRHDLASSWHALGKMCNDTGRHDDAEKNYRQALALAERLADEFPARHQYRTHVAKYRSNLAGVLSATNRPEEAERLYRQAVASAERAVREAPQERDYESVAALTHATLAFLLMNTGRTGEAEREYRRCLELMKKLVADFPSRPDYRSFYARSYSNLGMLYSRLDRRDDAEAAWNENCKIQEKLAADYPLVAQYQSDLGAALSNRAARLNSRGELEPARALLEEAVRRQQAALKVNPKEPRYRTFLGTHYLVLAVVLRRQKRPEVDQVHQQAIAVWKELVADFPGGAEYESGLGSALMNRALLLRDRRRLAEALQLLDEAIRHHEKAHRLNPRNSQHLLLLSQDLANRAQLCGQLGSDTEAAASRRQMIAVLEQLCAQQPTAAPYWRKLGEAHYRAGNARDALAALDRAVKLRKGDDAASWFLLTLVHQSLDHPAEARRWYDQAVGWVEKNGPALVKDRRLAAELRILRSEAEKVLQPEQN
jgi:serine/threonine protein kinase/Flp pilus assembly protein TadD